MYPANIAQCPRKVTVLAKDTDRPSGAMDLFLNNKISHRLRHKLGTFGSMERNSDIIKWRSFIAFNENHKHTTWNPSFGPRTKIKGDVLLVKFDTDRKAFLPITDDDIREIESNFCLPLAFFFPNMKNSH